MRSGREGRQRARIEGRSDGPGDDPQDILKRCWGRVRNFLSLFLLQFAEELHASKDFRMLYKVKVYCSFFVLSQVLRCFFGTDDGDL